MRLLLIGDLHLTFNNIEHVDQLFQFIKTHTINSVDELIFMGDVFHTHSKTDTQLVNYFLTHLKNIIEIKPSIVIHIIIGNHDMINNKTFCEPEKNWSCFISIPNVIFYSTPSVYKQMLFVPYTFPGKFNEAIDIFVKDTSKVICCFAHQEFRGVQMGAIQSEVGDEYTFNFPCFSGHIHDQQTLYGGKVKYVGAALQHTFGSSECCLWVLHLPTLCLEKIPHGILFKQKFTLNLETDCEQKIKAALEKCADIPVHSRSGKLLVVIKTTDRIKFTSFVQENCKSFEGAQVRFVTSKESDTIMTGVHKDFLTSQGILDGFIKYISTEKQMLATHLDKLLSKC